MCLTCILEVSGLSSNWVYSKLGLSWFSSFPLGECEDSVSNYPLITLSTPHPSHSPFMIPYDAIYSDMLIVTSCKYKKS